LETGCLPVFVFFGGEMAKRGRKQKSKCRQKATHFLLDTEARKRQQAVVDSVARLAEPLCQSEGLELVHVEYQREPGGVTLRIYLDKPGGVTLDDCVDVSRQLEDLLDVHASDLPPYRLEVSSPGVDRPVGKLEDYRRFTGQRARIRLAAPVNGRKNFTGVLDGVFEEKIRLKMDDGIVHLGFSDILRARLINFNGEH
jgi:ribosome maturation factor RimP